jgi:hypothetical protein
VVGGGAFHITYEFLGFSECYFACLDSQGKKKSRWGIHGELGYGGCEIHLECNRGQYPAEYVRASPLLGKFARPSSVGFSLQLLGRVNRGAFPVGVESFSKCRLELVEVVKRLDAFEPTMVGKVVVFCFDVLAIGGAVFGIHVAKASRCDGLRVVAEQRDGGEVDVEASMVAFGSVHERDLLHQDNRILLQGRSERTPNPLLRYQLL